MTTFFIAAGGYFLGALTVAAALVFGRGIHIADLADVGNAPPIPAPRFALDDTQEFDAIRDVAS